MALLYVYLMASEAQRAKEPLSLHNGIAMRQLSIIKPSELKPIY